MNKKSQNYFQKDLEQGLKKILMYSDQFDNAECDFFVRNLIKFQI